MVVLERFPERFLERRGAADPGIIGPSLPDAEPS